MSKIIGLLDLKELFIFKNPVANLENAINAAYKLSEDGAKGIAIYGKSLKEKYKIYKTLKPRMDIPVSIVIKSEKQIELVKDTANIFLTTNTFKAKKNITVVKEIKKINDLANLKNTAGILITNKIALRIFKSEPDYIDEIIAILSCKLRHSNIDLFLTENVLSAKKGAEVCRKLLF